MRLDLEWFRTFKAIYETGTLSAAAQELFISQPGVSLHLNSLEAYTGYQLFERSARKMTPTEKGKILYNCILDPIKRLESAEQLFHKRAHSERPTLSIGMCFETFQYTLEEHVAALPFNLIIKFGEYHQMQSDLDSGLLDLIVSPNKGQQKNITYQSFSKERVILIAGGNTDAVAIEKALLSGNYHEAKALLKQQFWYSTAADMEHLTNFWKKNFDEHPDFRPNFIVPNISSIIRCLTNGNGLSIVPDFLCREAIASGSVKALWEGKTPLDNTLYFGTRKNTLYLEQITQLQEIFKEKWEPAVV